MDKRSSLLPKVVNYDRTRFIKLIPGRLSGFCKSSSRGWWIFGSGLGPMLYYFLRSQFI